MQHKKSEETKSTWKDMHEKLKDIKGLSTDESKIKLSDLKFNDPNVTKMVKKLINNETFYSVKDNPEAITFAKKLSKRASYAAVKRDAEALLDFLSPAVELSRISRDTTTKEIKDAKGNVVKLNIVTGRAKESDIANRLHFLKNNLPHVIFIAGNNDLNQIDDTLRLLSQLKDEITKDLKSESKAADIVANIPVVFSGKGGHGVAPGPIFATSEAEAMSEFFKKQFLNLLGVPHDAKSIFIEDQSTNSGQNVDFTKPIIKKIIEKQIKSAAAGIRILLVPTPTGGIRQLATVCQQAESDTVKQKVGDSKVDAGGEGYQVASVYMLPNKKNIMRDYYDISQANACVNFLAALREVVNHIGYMLENDFMSAHAPHELKMRRAMEQVLIYHQILSGEKHTLRDKESLINNLVKFSKLKEKAGSIDALSSEAKLLRAEIKKEFDPVKAFFQMVFSHLERQEMEYLAETRPRMTAKEQGQLVAHKKYKRIFDQYGLDPVKKVSEHKKAQLKKRK